MQKRNRRTLVNAVVIEFPDTETEESMKKHAQSIAEETNYRVNYVHVRLYKK